MGDIVPPRSRLLALLSVHHEERPLVGGVLLFALCLYGGHVLVNTVSFALFLTRFSGETLPYVYLASSAASVLLSALTIRLSERFSLSAVSVATVAGLLVVTLLYRLALVFSTAAWLVFALPVFAALTLALIVNVYENLIGRLFTLEQGKRLFGLLSTGELGASVIAGLVSPALVALAGANNLLLFGAGAFLVALLVLMRLARRFGGLLAAEEAVETPGDGARPVSLLRNRYIMLLVTLTLLYTIAVYLINNIFYIQAELRFPDEDRLASFLGLFTGVLGGLTLFLQLFVAGRVLNRFGVRPILLAAPGLTLLWIAPYAVVAAAGGAEIALFALAVAANLSIMAIDALDSPSFSLLFQVFPATIRTRAQTLVNGVIYPAAIGAAGLLLVVLFDVLHAGPLQAAWLLLAIAVVWIVVASLLGRAYPRQVAGALHKRLFSGATLDRPDRSSLDVIRAGLRRPRAGAVLYSLELLEAFGPDEVLRVGAELLEHPAEEVRLRALDVLERQQLVALLPAIIARRTRETAPAVRGAIERATAVLGGALLLDETALALDSTDPAVRIGAMTGLLRSGDMESMLLAFERLQRWVQDPDPATRLEAVQALHDAEIAALYRPVSRLLLDDDRSVRLASLKAAGRLRHPQLWPLIIRRLDSPGEREAAMNALVAGGPAALRAIAETLRAPYRREPATRARYVRLARAAGRIGGPEAIDILLDVVDVPDLEVHSQVLQSLRRAGYRAPAAQAEQWLQSEAARAACLLRARADLVAGPALADQPAAASDLLLAALADVGRRMRRNVFHCLAFLYDPALIDAIQSNLERPGDDRAAREGRAYARETCETQIAPPARNWVRPLLDESPPVEAFGPNCPEQPLERAERLQQLCDETNWTLPWVQACALYTLAALRRRDAAACVRGALASPEPVVREMAVWAESCLEPDHPEALVGLVDDPSPQCAALVRHILDEGDDSVMLTTVEKVIALKGAALFAGTPDDVLADLVRLLRQVETPAGTEVFSKGDAGNSMYIIAEGTVRIHDGAMEFQRLEEGDVFGEMSLLDPAPRSASATAVTDCVLLELPGAPFFELLEDYSVVSRQIMQMLTRRLRQTMVRASERLG